ncbi:hypothetical protein DAEQUDRAFT_755157 [Daedalea quercina L-15889]|uniref:N-acetyltransferase domain-containing protein n=1 Tax=Daedalea quercina L-15889 TaxID=1314783 RepID=A0A165SPJ9_9APHY|nr:hypothetical protein DAEQUDRAFT_755157 [Daedalea quercina L-15889]
MSPASSTTHAVVSVETFSFALIPGDRISQGLFENYGTWGPLVTFSKPGNRVRMTPSKFKDQLIPDDPANTVLATCRLGEMLIGQAFATTWGCDSVDDSGKKTTVGWITQLVVDKSYRGRGIALLHTLMVSDAFQGVSVLGVASSHPATCAALARLARTAVGSLDLDFTHTHARDVLAQTPVRYLDDAELHGSLFGGDHPRGAVCSIFTRFYIDHEEPLRVLQTFKDVENWSLGELHEGYEFLVVVSRDK